MWYFVLLLTLACIPLAISLWIAYRRKGRIRVTAASAVAWFFAIVAMIFLFDAINTELTFRRIHAGHLRHLQEIDSPRRFSIIGTDGEHASADFSNKTYGHFAELQSLGEVPATRVAVVFQMPGTSAVDSVFATHAHFSRIGIENYFMEYEPGKYQRLFFDMEPDVEGGSAHENTMELRDSEVLFSGHSYLLDGESADALRTACDSSSAPLVVLCRGETQCGTLMKLIGAFNLAPHRELHLTGGG